MTGVSLWAQDQAKVERLEGELAASKAETARMAHRLECALALAASWDISASANVRAMADSLRTVISEPPKERT